MMSYADFYLSLDALSMITMAIAHYFPNKLSAKDLQRVFPELRERYFNYRDDSSVLPNLNDDTAIVVSADRALNSYVSLFCRRCYVYNCLLHRGKSIISFVDVFYVFQMMM